MEEARRISAWKELRIYSRQYRIILLSDIKNLLVMLLFPVVAALITVWIAGENMYVHFEGTKSACFVIVSAAIWGGLFNSIQIVVKERANVKREYMSGARLQCYVASRAMIQLVLCAFQSLILCTAFWGVEQCYGNALPESGILLGHVTVEYYISILLLMYAADMMGLMISCMVKKTETANVMAPYILIVQLIFSGILFTMKGGAEKLSYLMLSRWGMEALGSISDLNELPLKIQLEVPGVEHEAESMFTHTAGHLWLVWGVFLVFILAFAVIGNLVLFRVSKDSR